MRVHQKAAKIALRAVEPLQHCFFSNGQHTRAVDQTCGAVRDAAGTATVTDTMSTTASARRQAAKLRPDGMLLFDCGNVRMIRMRSSYLCVVCDRFDLLREASIKSHVHACGPFSSSGDWSGCRSALETHLTAKLCPLVRPDFPAALSCFSPISGTTKLAVPTAFVADAAALSLQHHGPIAWGSYDYADRRGLSRVQCV